MAYIEDIETEATKLLKKMGTDWLGNRLAQDTTFNISASDGSDLETTLNYMLWRGWIERPLVENLDGSVASAVVLTTRGQELAMSYLHGRKPEATPEPSKGRLCPY